MKKTERRGKYEEERSMREEGIAMSRMKGTDVNKVSLMIRRIRPRPHEDDCDRKR